MGSQTLTKIHVDIWPAAVRTTFQDRPELYKQATRLSPKQFLSKQHDLSSVGRTLPVPSKDEFILVLSSQEDRLHQPSLTPAASGHIVPLCMNGGLWCDTSHREAIGTAQQRE